MLNLVMFSVLRALLWLTYPLGGTRLWRVPCAIDSAMDRWLSHDVAERFGLVCTSCYDEAPDWWEFEVDCAGHNCGQCDECLGKTWYDDERVEQHIGFELLESALHRAIAAGDLTTREALELQVELLGGSLTDEAIVLNTRV